MTVVTLDNNNDEELYLKLEAASWFKDELGLTKKGKKKKGYLKPELLYDLDGNCSINTLHECNDKVHCKEGAKSELDGEEEERRVCQRTPHPKAIILSCIKLRLLGRQIVHVEVYTLQPVLVLNPQASMTQQGMDSPHQLPPLTHRGGTATGIKWHV